MLLTSHTDKDIDLSLPEISEEINIPTMKQAPRTMFGTKRLLDDFNNSIEKTNHVYRAEELKWNLLSKEIVRKTPFEQTNELTPSKVQDL